MINHRFLRLRGCRARLHFEVMDFRSELLRARRHPEVYQGPSRRLRLDAQEAIQDSDELLNRCAGRGYA